eukprot:Gregarina_sp_Pseudo_9__2508@NODE_2785_length_875_cov_18_539474_g2548_i0_p1_GENE_NODE_2785_length_875_cov_18_539474_g2548_i0NODE_2785_length_875_cov_18_539474_g2548_i0_p1_ORF_typecomplete_len206_score10_81RRM_1/PF00076_22/2_7e13RRM_3/PF08777_11/0_00026RRM_5/PF13893_6/0_0091DUF4651/PF15513_6/0_065RRM_8/PF11835_8/0_28_NODE_2785_length_875_cov_18_539474_g2548_i044661
MTTVDPVALDMSLGNASPPTQTASRTPDEVIARGRSAPASANSRGFRPKVQNKIRKSNKAFNDSGPNRNSRRGGNNQGSFVSHNTRTPWDMRSDNEGPRKRRAPMHGRILRISGLEFSVLQEDLQELFAAVGPIEKVWIDYDRTDRSMGTGSVIFENPRDAIRAQEIYHGRSIDGSVIALELAGGVEGRGPFQQGRRPPPRESAF